MAAVAMVFNARSEFEEQPPKDPHQVRYLAGFYDLDELGLHWRRQAAQVGWDEAERQIALTDVLRVWKTSLRKTHRSRCESSISITPANMSRN